MAAGLVAAHSFLDGVMRPFLLLCAGPLASLLAASLARRGSVPAAARPLFCLLVATGSRGTHDPGLLAF